MRTLAVVMLTIAVPVSMQAQQNASLTYAISRDGATIGEEVTSLTAGDARNPGGSTLVIRAHYPGSPRDSAIEAMLQRDRDHQLILFQLDLHEETGGTTILAAGSGARVLLRTDTPGSRAVREVPAGENVVLLDDHVLGLYQAVADLATSAGASHHRDLSENRPEGAVSGAAWRRGPRPAHHPVGPTDRNPARRHRGTDDPGRISVRTGRLRPLTIATQPLVGT